MHDPKAFLVSTDERAMANITMHTKDSQTGETISGTWSTFNSVFFCDFGSSFRSWSEGVPVTIEDNTTGAIWQVYLTNYA